LDSPPLYPMGSTSAFHHYRWVHSSITHIILFPLLFFYISSTPSSTTSSLFIFLVFQYEDFQTYFNDSRSMHQFCRPSDKIILSKCQDLCVCCHHNINPYIGRVEIWSSREFYIRLNIYNIYFFNITSSFTSSCILYFLTLLLT
jgi:hypothetical protein